MDDQASAAGTLPPLYRCPGQSHAIDRTTHLARLATFYPVCLECQHRHDTSGLSPLQLRDRDLLERRAPEPPRLCEEGLEGQSSGAIDAALVARAAGAVGSWLWHRRGPAAGRPAVLVGTDGSWHSADFVPAACRALQLAGCTALEVGAVTSPCLVAAACHRQAAAAMWLGNSSGNPHAVSIKLWQQAGAPCSSPGALDELLVDWDAPRARPKRSGGELERYDAVSVYLPLLEGMFHGLRPLIVVLDTTCEALIRYWQRLTAETACRIVRPRGGLADRTEAATDRPWRERRQDVVSHDVLAARAHLGVCIDGDGETCHFVDERGASVSGESVMLLLAGLVCDKRPGTTIAVEESASVNLQRALERRGARVFRAGRTRQAMCERIAATGASVGGGASGRYWYWGPPAMCDALWGLSVVASILSQSDRAFSEVLDAAWASG
jgi:phosphomannomutase